MSTLTDAREAAADRLALIIPSWSADPTSVPTSSSNVGFSAGDALLLDALEDEDVSLVDSPLSDSDSDPLSEL